MPDVPGVILAGGRSSRMGGGDKGLLPLGERPILAHVIERFGAQASPLAINANGDAARFKSFRLPVVKDSVGGFAGPLAGVLAGLDWAAGFGAERIVSAAADTPFLPADLVDRLVAGANESGHALAIAATSRPRGEGWSRHPTFGLWPVALRDDLREALGKGVRKVIDWTEPHGCARVEFPAEGFDPFFNVNTPDDMAAAKGMLLKVRA